MRLPTTLKQQAPSSDVLEAFAYEAKQEAAVALGRIGKQLEATLEAIKRHDEAERPNTNREDLIWDAAEKSMALMIQREAFGLRSSADVQAFYNIPREVMIRIGAKRPKERSPL